MESPTRSVRSLSIFKRMLIWPVAMLVRLWSRTITIEVDELFLKILKQNEKSPTVFIFWHNLLFLAGEKYRRFRHKRKLFGLISASNDGAWLVAFLENLGIGAIRGSSSFQGSQAFKQLLEKLQEGYDVAITPDGPRGPRYQLKEGVVKLLELSNAPFVMMGCKLNGYWRLNSWDGFLLPKPFSKVRVQCVRYENLNEFLAFTLKGASNAALNPNSRYLLEKELMHLTFHP
jgi:lysophospholipid acyltransferase (LPLAT)-like uncharacterized protein